MYRTLSPQMAFEETEFLDLEGPGPEFHAFPHEALEGRPMPSRDTGKLDMWHKGLRLARAAECDKRSFYIPLKASEARTFGYTGPNCVSAKLTD